MPKVLKKEQKTTPRRIQPNRRVKRKSEVIIKKLDIIGNLKRLDQPDLTHQIFSYLDFTSLQRCRVVCKTWNHSLNNDQILWMKILKRTRPYLEKVFFYIDAYKNKDDREISAPLWAHADSGAFIEFAKEFFEWIEEQQNLHFKQMFQVFGKIQTTIIMTTGYILISHVGPGLLSERFNNDFKNHLPGDFAWEKPNFRFERFCDDLKYHLAGEKFMEDFKQTRNPFRKWLKKNFKVLKKYEDDKNFANLHNRPTQVTENDIQNLLETILGRLKKEFYF